MAHALFELIAAAESEVARSEFLGAIAGHLKLPVGALQRDFETFLRRSLRHAPASADAQRATFDAQPAASIAETPEQHLSSCSRCTSRRSASRSARLFRKIGSIPATPPGCCSTGSWARSNTTTGPVATTWTPCWKPRKNGRLWLRCSSTPPAIDDPAKIAREGLHQLRTRALEPRLRKIELDLANHRADSEGDPISLIKERSELQRQLRQPIGFARSCRLIFLSHFIYAA